MTSLPPLTTRTLHFSTFPITSQLFHLSTHSYAIVNLKPLLPGHVLVCPQRCVPRLHQLRVEEVADLFLTVQNVGRAVEKIYKAQGLNIAVQDGVVAGQSVPHVHAHIIPRHAGDLKEDEIYRLLESDDADLEKAFRQQEDGGGRKSRFPVTEEKERRPRSEEEMAAEAEWLRRKMEELE